MKSLLLKKKKKINNFTGSQDIPEVSFGDSLVIGFEVFAAVVVIGATRLTFLWLLLRLSMEFFLICICTMVSMSLRSSIFSFLRGCTTATLDDDFLSPHRRLFFSFSDASNAFVCSFIALHLPLRTLIILVWLQLSTLLSTWADFTEFDWCCFDRFFTLRSQSGNGTTFLGVVLIDECSMDAPCLSYHGWLRSTRAIIGNCRSSNAAFWYFGFTIAVGIWIFCFASSAARSTLSVKRFDSGSVAVEMSNRIDVCAFASRTQLPMANDSFAFDRTASTICKWMMKMWR